MTPDVSVVVSTFNRCEVLRGAIESLITQDAGSIRYEVIIVDNNSTDQTRKLVESFREQGHDNLTYCFEPQQGISYARNTGISAARAALIAFMDDDVRAGADWIRSIKAAFDEFQDADCIGGKVLPLSKSEFPRWLTREHWKPLALLDLGEEPIHLDVLNGPGLVGANMAVRASVFAEVCGFNPKLQRVKDTIGSMEDHEFLVNITQSGKHVMYVPGMVVKAHMFAERFTKAYHRRWHAGHGHFYALMRSEEFESSKAKFLDVPGHLYRRAWANLCSLIVQRLKGRRDQSFRHEVELIFFWGYFRQRTLNKKADGPNV
jgi:glycosyltransferase involved in cell wall biosynthesis